MVIDSDTVCQRTGAINSFPLHRHRHCRRRLFSRETTPQEQQACDDLLYSFLTITSNKLYIFIWFRKWKRKKTERKNFVNAKCPQCMRPTGISKVHFRILFVYTTYVLEVRFVSPNNTRSPNIDSGFIRIITEKQERR